jgi:hypothetical protein
MENLDMIETVLLIFVALALGYAWGSWDTIRSLSAMLARLNIQAEDLQALAPAEELSLEILVEQHGTTLLAYRSDDLQFLTQAQTSHELISQLAELLPTGTRVICKQDQGAELIQDAIRDLG